MMTTESPVESLTLSQPLVSAIASGQRVLVAILGSTATGKSALGIRLAERYGGEIVGCDSTAVYRELDIGTDKVDVAAQRGVPHHMVDIVEPTVTYTAAEYARAASSVIEAVHRRGRLPILVGGTGFYYRALTRGLFPGPGRDPQLRARLQAIAARRGWEFLHRMVKRVDPASAARIQARDGMRLVRALEVYFKTGRPLTAHFAETVSPLAGFTIMAVALRLPRPALEDRIARRVDEQFARGLLDEIRGLIARGIPETAHCFSGLVYRQAIEHLHGVRDEAATRALIVRENLHYARRQLIWFRKEPNLVWTDGAGEHPRTLAAVERDVNTRLSAGLVPLKGIPDGSNV
jgi:tRNA dimethylallyltransferase